MIDYATPALLGTLAFLALILYLRMGALIKANNKKPVAATPKTNSRAVQAYVLHEVKSNNYQLSVKRTLSSVDLVNSIKNHRKHIILNGKLYRVEDVTEDQGNFILTLDSMPQASGNHYILSI